MLRSLVVVGAGCAVVALFLPLPHSRPEVIDYPLIVPVAVVVGAAVGAFRGWRFAALAAAVLVVVAVSAAIVVDVRSGLPARDLPVLAVGAVAVAVGAAFDVGPQVGWGSWRRQVVGVVAGLLAVGLTVVAPGVVDAWAATSVVGMAGRAAEVAERPGARQWTWESSSAVLDLVPAGRGVVVATARGEVVGLDGTGGSEVWRYERLGARVGGVVASADRRTVLVLFERHDRAPHRLLVVLDAATGAVRFERTVGPLRPSEIEVGADVYVEADNSAITAYDLVTGDVRWQWTGSGECGAPHAALAGAGRERVSFALRCLDRLAVVGLDQATGEERWRHEVALPGQRGAVSRYVEAKASADGSVLAVEMSGEELPPDAITNGLVDTATGRLVRLDGPASSVVVTAGRTPLLRTKDDPVVRADDPATGATTALDTGTYGLQRAEVTTTRTYLRLCYRSATGVTLVSQDLAGGPATTIPLDSLVEYSGIDAQLVAAPGAVVLAGKTRPERPSVVVGFAT